MLSVRRSIPLLFCSSPAMVPHGAPYPYTMFNEYLRAQFRTSQLKLLRLLPGQSLVSPAQYNNYYLNRLKYAQGDPKAILSCYEKIEAETEEIPYEFLTQALFSLGTAFDKNSFWSLQDKNRLTQNLLFRQLVCDLRDRCESQLILWHVPKILYAFANLEYRNAEITARCAQLLQEYLNLYNTNQAFKTRQLTFPALASIIYSLAELGIGDESLHYFKHVKFTGLLSDLIIHTYTQYGLLSSSGDDNKNLNSLKLQAGAYTKMSVVHDWSKIAYAMVINGLYDLSVKVYIHPETKQVIPAHKNDKTILNLMEKYSDNNSLQSDTLTVLPNILGQFCSAVNTPVVLDKSGWLQYILYLTLYCTDVEKPLKEEEIKRAVPMWIQERLHVKWLDSILINSQPIGTSLLQQSVAESIRRTNTQSLLNVSVGRPNLDESHVFFAGHKLFPHIILEYNNYHPLMTVNKSGGLCKLKERIFPFFGLITVTIHANNWYILTEDERDETIQQIKSAYGYRHDHYFDATEVRDGIFGRREMDKQRWKPVALHRTNDPIPRDG